jgi:hypothetical protein
LRLFLAFDLLPIEFDLSGRVYLPIAKDMGMSSHHFFAHALQYLLHLKLVLFSIEAGQENRHEDQIAKLFRDLLGSVVIHCIHQFIDFLEEVAFDGGWRLLAIPRAAVLGSQLGYEIQQPLEFFSGLGHFVS